MSIIPLVRFILSVFGGGIFFYFLISLCLDPLVAAFDITNVYFEAAKWLVSFVTPMILLFGPMIRLFKVAQKGDNY